MAKYFGTDGIRGKYGEKLDEAFAAWKAKEYPALSSLDEDVSARELIISLAEDILAEFEHLTLIDKYDVYQVLLAYWNEVMNDDVSLIISEPDGYANARVTDNVEEEITQGKNKGDESHRMGRQIDSKGHRYRYLFP
mgnify:CR=1 FL=1